jgi:cell division protein FtsI/penicillin-binding protein 2
MDYSIPEKANRVLNVIILGLLLILIRVWYLAIIQHDVHVEKARKPKRRTVIEQVERATIRDRFNIPLALNKIQYNAAVCYADIRHIPATKWETNAEGKRVRVPLRAEYIKKLARLLAQELQMDCQKIEDIIHGKASLFPHTPFVIKEEISEQEYHRLKMLEKDWVGIRTERGSKRYYPLGKTAGDLIGYLGSISSNEYYRIAQELNILQTYLSAREAGEAAVLPKGFHNPLEVREKLKVLQEKAYSINALLGKSGLEASFDAELRGYPGKKTYEVDTKGNFLRELPGGRNPVPGQRLLLSISSELQEFAEQLLAANETVREARHPDGTPDLSTPWIKGGAIVAFDPNNGEVLAMASYPRIDPNDFIPSRTPDIKASKQAAVAKWLENETYISQIWDGKRPLERERFDENTQTFFTEKLDLTWERYLQIILPPNSEVQAAMHKIHTVGEAIALQMEIEKLIKLSGSSQVAHLIDAMYFGEAHHHLKIPTPQEEVKKIQEELAHTAEFHFAKAKLDTILSSIKHNDDKLLIIDLCRMLVNKEKVAPDLMEQVATLSLAGFHRLNQCYSSITTLLHNHARDWFYQIDFQKWREEHFKDYLKAKRQEEKARKQYAKPYTEYLDQLKKEFFKTFWDEHRLEFIHALIYQNDEEHSTLAAYLPELYALIDTYPEIKKQAEIIKQTTASLTSEKQRQFLQMMRPFEELDRPLYGHYRSLRQTKGIQLEKHLAAAFYPLAGYGYGRSQAFRQSTPQGSVFKLVIAYQALLERYQKLKELARTFEDINPLTLIDNIKWHPKPGSLEQVLGYTMDGQTIKRLYKGGILPRTHPNIGKIDTIGAIEQSSNIYFSIIAAECVEDPLNLIKVCKAFGYGEKTGIELPGEIVGILPDDLTHNRTGLYSFAIGQHSLIVTPLQTAVVFGALANQGKVLKPKIIQLIAGQEPLREYRDPFAQEHFPFQEDLATVGIHFPLFTATQTEKSEPYIWYNAPEIKRTLFMPDLIRDPLIQGMHRVINGPKGTARPQIIRALARRPHWMRNYLEWKNRLIGKTGTAEVFFKQTIDAESKAVIRNHIWFSGIAFAQEEPQSWQHPKLVVVVYLRFSEAGGKEATPLASEMLKKWEEIRKRHGCSSSYALPAGTIPNEL